MTHLHVKIDIKDSTGYIGVSVKYQRHGLAKLLPFKASNGVTICVLGGVGRPTVQETRGSLILAVRSDSCPLAYRDREVMARVKNPVVAKAMIKQSLKELRQVIEGRCRFENSHHC